MTLNPAIFTVPSLLLPPVAVKYLTDAQPDKKNKIKPKKNTFFLIFNLHALWIKLLNAGRIKHLTPD